MTMRSKAPCIAVVSWLNQEYGRAVLASVLEHAPEYGVSDIRFADVDSLSVKKKELLEVDGIIAVVDGNDLPLFHGYTKSLVHVPRGSGATPPGILSVATDNRLAGQLAASHLLSLGLEHFAVRGHPQSPGYEQLIEGFAGRLNASGVGDVRYTPPEAWTNCPALHEWIRALPKPCGVLCRSDGAANVFYSYAEELGVRIPDDVAVVGIDNDLIRCLRHHPTLTSIAHSTQAIGRIALVLLLELLDGRKPESVVLPPGDLVVRGSTNTVVTDDHAVSKALKFIRNNFAGGITANDVAHHVGYSPKGLTKRLRKAMNTTAHEEIVRCRLEKAVALLTTTDMPIKRIAWAVGIPEPANFNRFIKQHHGMSPAQLRSSNVSAVRTIDP